MICSKENFQMYLKDGDLEKKDKVVEEYFNQYLDKMEDL